MDTLRSETITADIKFKWIFLRENDHILIEIPPTFVQWIPIDKSSLVQGMAMGQADDKPLQEPMMINSLMHIYVNSLQWVPQCLLVVGISDASEICMKVMLTILVPCHGLCWYMILAILDDNECADPNVCDQVCDNTEGSYSCRCAVGYTLGSNGRDCSGEPL